MTNVNSFDVAQQGYDIQEFDVDTQTSVGSGDSKFTFPNKGDKMIAKLLYQPRIDNDWKVSFKKYFDNQDKPSIQYVVKGVVIDRKTGTYTPTVFVLKPSQINQIISIIQTRKEEGIVFLAPKGQPVSLTKEGSGMLTQYKVAPLQREIDCWEYLGYWDKPLTEYAEELAKDKKEQVKEQSKLTTEEEESLFED